MNEKLRWEELRRRAGGHLSENFAARLQERVTRARRQRRQFRAMAATLLICLGGTSGTAAWQAYRQHEESLAQWRQYSAITLAMERTL